MVVHDGNHLGYAVANQRNNFLNGSSSQSKTYGKRRYSKKALDDGIITSLRDGYVLTNIRCPACSSPLVRKGMICIEQDADSLKNREEAGEQNNENDESVVESMVESLNGSIQAESRDGHENSNSKNRGKYRAQCVLFAPCVSPCAAHHTNVSNSGSMPEEYLESMEDYEEYNPADSAGIPFCVMCKSYVVTESCAKSDGEAINELADWMESSNFESETISKAHGIIVMLDDSPDPRHKYRRYHDKYSTLFSHSSANVTARTDYSEDDVSEGKGREGSESRSILNSEEEEADDEEDNEADDEEDDENDEEDEDEDEDDKVQILKNDSNKEKRYKITNQMDISHEVNQESEQKEISTERLNTTVKMNASSSEVDFVYEASPENEESTKKDDIEGEVINIGLKDEEFVEYRQNGHEDFSPPTSQSIMADIHSSVTHTPSVTTYSTSIVTHSPSFTTYSKSLATHSPSFTTYSKSLATHSPTIETKQSSTIEITQSSTTEKTESPTTEKTQSPITGKAQSPTIKQTQSPTIKRAQSPPVKTKQSPTVKEAKSPIETTKDTTQPTSEVTQVFDKNEEQYAALRGVLTEEEEELILSSYTSK